MSPSDQERLINEFPHLRVGTFIEALRLGFAGDKRYEFPHLRVGTFIEAFIGPVILSPLTEFPHLRVGTFIEAPTLITAWNETVSYFSTFGRGFSLRF